jgi:CSLREA domain-containing protein
MFLKPNHPSRARILCVAVIFIVVVPLVYLFPRSQSALAKNVIPSTVNAITVNSTSDGADGTDGLCTLREAITAANTNTSSGGVAGECVAGSSSSGDTIDLMGLTGTITLAIALPAISSDLTINGPGPGALTVLRNSGNFDGFSIISNATVTISGLKVQGGAPASNVGISNSGTLNVTNCVVSGFGLGMSNGPATLTVSNGVINGNTNGGGIANSQGTLNVTNSLISGNSGGGFAAGIDNLFGTINVTNSTITGSSDNRGVSNGIGSSATFINSTVSNNLNGGFLNNGTLSMTGGSIVGNSNGGMIASGTAVLNGVTISDNSTNSDFSTSGGGLITNGISATVINCLVANNFAYGNGGGIWNAGGKLILVNTTISGNTSLGSGGGLASVDGGLADFIGFNVTITNNRSNNGGGVFRESGMMRFKNSLIAGNQGLNGLGSNEISGPLDPLSSYNLIGLVGSGGLTNGVNNNLVGVLDARLGPLSNNGGPTLTHSLLVDSPALDAGDNCVTQASHCGEPKIPQLRSDQRGFNRIVDGPDPDSVAKVDIGAYETQLTLANLPDTNTNEDTQLVLPFDIGDASTITSITATSSNAALVSNDSTHINATVSGTTGVVTINPITNLSGTTTITITVNRSNVVPELKTFLLTVNPVDEAPSFIKGADQTVNEDADAQTIPNWATNLSAGPPDESGQTLSFQITNNTNAGLFSFGPAIDSAGTLSYTPAANANGSATITLVLKDNGGTANGGIDTSAPQTFVININPVNDAPSFTKGADQTVNEDSGPQFVPGWASGISVGPNEHGQVLTFQVTNNTNPSLFSSGPTVNSSGGLSYVPASNANGSASITLVLNDNGGTANGGADTSSPQSFTITVNPVNDVPSFIKGANQFVNNDAGAQSIINWATNIFPGPGDELGQTLTFEIVSNTNAGLFSVVPSVSPTGTLSYQPAPGMNGVANIGVRLKDNGGTTNGGTDTSASQSFSITVLPSGAALPLSLLVNALGDAADANVGDGICDTDAGTAGNQCTLRAAIQEANNAITDDTINFNLPASSTITLDSVLPDIAGNLSVNGPGANLLTVQRNAAGGTPDFRIFMINSGTTVAISGITIANGNLTAANNGGGIRNDGTLTLTNCNLFGNNVEQVGGAIFNNGTSLTLIDSNVGGTAPGQPNTGTAGGSGIYNNTGTLSINGGSIAGNSNIGIFVAGGTANLESVAVSNNGGSGGGGGLTAVNVNTNIIDCLIANNTAANGAGLYNQNGSMTVVNSTISGNVSSSVGGGVRNQSGTLTLTNVTITNNRSNSSSGGGVSASGTVNSRNSIIAGNFQGVSPSTSPSDVSGNLSFVNSFNNLIGIGGSGGLINSVNGNKVGVFSAGLGPLSNNGGPTQTHALLPGSPALDAGSNAFVTNPPFSGSAPFTDQRGAGFKRILDAADADTTQTVDIGAYEANPMIQVLGGTTINEDTPLPCVAYNVGDETEGFLSIVATSSNQSLVTDLDLNPNVPNGTGSRCLSMGVEPNQFGNTTITVTLTGNSGRSISSSLFLTVNPTGDAPSVTPSTTNEDTQSVSGLVITPNPVDGGEVTQFLITNIQNGTLFRSNGVSPISSNSSITLAEGSAGLKFTPAANLNSSSSNFGFTVQAMTIQGISSAGTGTNASLTVIPVNDAPAFTKGADVFVNQQPGGYVIPNWATNISPGAANESAQTQTFQVLSNSNPGLFSIQPAIDSSGTLTFTGAPNTIGTAIITINLKDDGGTALGGQDTSPPQMFNLTITNPPISLVVNTLGDAFEWNPGDGICDVDPAPGDQCTLRAAIQETNLRGAASGSSISFDLPTPATIVLNGGFGINTNLTITGPGSNLLTLQRNPAPGTPDFRPFTVYAGMTAQISGLTITNGNVVSNFPENSGGGIFNSGTLTLTDVVVSGNSAEGAGGGIFVDHGTLSLNNSRIVGNQAASGGGISNQGTSIIDLTTVANNTATSFGAGIVNSSGGDQQSVLKVNRSTISNNSCQGNGGGVVGGGGIYNIGTAFATNSTISTNSAPNGGGILNVNPMTLVNVTITGNTATTQGGGVYNLGTSINFGNSIIAGNSAPSGPDVSGFNFNSLDYNLFGNTNGANFTGTTTHSLTNVNPLLGPLLDNGGPTKTHALFSGSPALEAGNNALITNPPFLGPPFTDQRGINFNRIADGDGNTTATVDIGAYEQQGTLTIDNVNTKAGRTAGGQQIVLTGTFASLSTLTMGGLAASWSYTNGAGDTTSITVTTPAHLVGVVQIDLTPTSGSSYSKLNAFAYLQTVFTDNTLTVGQTTSKAQHVIELRRAVDALRAVAGLGPVMWTDGTLAPSSNVIKAIHIQELRAYLDDAAIRLGYATSPYTDPGLGSGFVIKRIHIEELRQRIRTIAG